MAVPPENNVDEGAAANVSIFTVLLNRAERYQGNPHHAEDEAGPPDETPRSTNATEENADGQAIPNLAPISRQRPTDPSVRQDSQPVMQICNR